jgi:flagellar basal-body rod modification protein FlgD
MAESVINTSTTNVSSTAALTNKSESKFNADFNDFLKILTTQLKNQDPTAPLDTNQFTQQIIQFSAVEQSINQNKKLDELISLSKVNQTSSLIGFSGKEVVAKGSSINLDGTGKASFDYEIDSGKDYESATVIIKNSEGRIVHTEEIEVKAGRKTYNWEAKDSLNEGKNLPAGIYTVEVSAKTSDSLTADAQQTFIKGIVTGMNLQSGNPSLIVNGEVIPLEDVEFLGQQQTTAAVTAES